MFNPLHDQQFENICEILDNTLAIEVGQRYNLCYRSHLGQPFILRHKLTSMGLSDDVDKAKICGI
jgi:hypothetical protein